MKGAADTGRNELLARRVADDQGMSMVQARDLVGAVISAIREELAATGRLTIRGFGRFTLRHVPEHASRSPSTGAPSIVSAHEKIAFRSAHFQNVPRDTSADNRDDASPPL